MNKTLLLLIIIAGSFFTLGNQVLLIKSTISENKNLIAKIKLEGKNKLLNFEKVKIFLSVHKYCFTIKNNHSNIVLTIKLNEVSKIISFLNNEIKLNHLNLISYKIFLKDEVYQMEFVFLAA